MSAPCGPIHVVGNSGITAVDGEVNRRPATMAVRNSAMAGLPLWPCNGSTALCRPNVRVNQRGNGMQGGAALRITIAPGYACVMGFHALFPQAWKYSYGIS